MPVVGAPAKASWVLKLVAKVLLSSWVLKRVKHPDILAVLADVARQVGRMEIVVQIHEKLQAGRI